MKLPSTQTNSAPGPSGEPARYPSKRRLHLLLVLLTLLIGADAVFAQSAADDINITLNLPEQELFEGEPLRFSMTVCNDGTPAVYYVRSSFLLPAVMKLQSVSVDVGSCEVSGQQVNCAWPALAPSQCAQVDVVAVPEGGGVQTVLFEHTVDDVKLRFPNAESKLTMRVRRILDYGDAPDSYRTLRQSNGARHRIVPGWKLGPLIDREPNGQPSWGADGDDLTNQMDEDGVRFLTALQIGGTATIQVLASTNCFLDAWMDFNMNHSFDGPERIFFRQALVRGVNTLSFDLPEARNLLGQIIGGGMTYSRFRMSRYGGLNPAGYAPIGEVEDYRVRLENPDTIIDWEILEADWEVGQPSTVRAFGYNVAESRLYGVRIVVEVPESMALQSASSTLGEIVVDGRIVTVSIDGIDAGESFALDLVVEPRQEGTHQIAFWSLPHGDEDRLSHRPRLSALWVGPTRDFGDAPYPTYPTLLANDGARHFLASRCHLGQLIDGERDAQLGTLHLGSGDDRHNLDDEDGVLFLTPVIPGNVASIRVETWTGGRLDAWLDLNANGEWSPDEQVFDSRLLPRGFTYLDFMVGQPVGGLFHGGFGYMRFRLSRDGDLEPGGYAPTGEVEDYFVFIGNPERLHPEYFISRIELLQGQLADLSLTVSPNLDSAATALTIMTEFPEDVTVYAASTEGGSCAVAGQTVTCQVNGVPADASVVVEFQVQATTARTLTPLVTLYTPESGLLAQNQEAGSIAVGQPLWIWIAENVTTGEKAMYWTNPHAVLEEALDPAGRWRVVEGAESPYKPKVENGRKRFYRLRLDMSTTGPIGASE